MKRWMVAGLSVLAFCAGGVQTEVARASVVALTIEDLTQGADLVFRGMVVDKTSEWTENGAMIETTIVLMPQEVLKGSTTGVVTLRLPGGDLGGLSIRAAEAPAYALGEDVVVFGRALTGGAYDTYGWFQGKYTLLNGEVREMLDTSWVELRARIQRAL